MTMVMFDYTCVQSLMFTHTQCFMLIVKDKVMYVVVHVGRLLLVTSMLGSHDNGNVGLHVCANFHHECFMLIVKDKVIECSHS